MSLQNVRDLIGEDLTGDALGQDMAGPDLTAGYIPNHSVLFIPKTVIGDPVAGPPSDQPLQIFRDNRPIATDELGMEGPWILESKKHSHRAAGRTFPLNYDWIGPFEFERTYGMVPEQDTLHPSVITPDNTPSAHDGVPPVELLENPHTVYFTASPAVGWAGY
jgi:hypothetical protein